MMLFSGFDRVWHKLTRRSPSEKETNMRQVLYVEYESDMHLSLILHGWKEHHCLVADGRTLIKLVKT